MMEGGSRISYRLVLRTLADHQAFTLGAFCWECDRSVTLDRQTLADRFGREVLLGDIRRRLLLAGGHLSHRLFGDMLRRIRALPVPAG